MTELQTQILTLLNQSTQTVTSAKTFDLADLLERHPDFPHCERYVVDLVNTVKSIITTAGYSISKSDLLNTYQKYSGVENANENRTDEIIRKIAR